MHRPILACNMKKHSKEYAIKILRTSNVKEIPNGWVSFFEDKDDTSYIYWDENFKMHRDDGPAYNRGLCKSWYKHGLHHREDGPAIEFADSKVWYYNGKNLKCKSQEEFEIFKRFIAFL